MSRFVQPDLRHIPFPDGRPGTAAVSDGQTVYLSQLTVVQPTGPTDIRTQTQQVLGLLQDLLEQAGSGAAQLLQLTFTVADSRCIPAVQQVYDRWKPNPGPVLLWRFGRLPGVLMAVDAVAAVRQRSGPEKI